MSRRAAAAVRLVLVTTPTARLAATIARTLVRQRLAACVNCLPRVRSVFRWQGRVDDCAETLLIIKTTARCLPSLMRAVRQHHTYTVPEILVLPAVGGHDPYLRWVVQSCAPKPKNNSS